MKDLNLDGMPSRINSIPNLTAIRMELIPQTLKFKLGLLQENLQKPIMI